MQVKSLVLALCVLCVLLIALGVEAKDEKLKPEQLIEKHLQSIGPAAKLKDIKSRMANGTARVDFRVGASGGMNGEGSFVSNGNAVRMGFRFPALDYPGEQFASDGDKVTVGQINPGNRSPLGRFVYENDVLLKESLLFGSLSTSWALLNTATRQPKLDLNGPKKIDGRSLYELKYTPKKSNGNIQAWFYFDTESFRHVRSQIKAEIVTGSVQRIADSAETVRYTLIEEFGDFKEVDGLTLPHSYKLDFSIDSPRGGFVGNWSCSIGQIRHNEPVERSVFAVN
jgi:hypothetical protein